MTHACRHLSLTGLTLKLQIDHSSLAPEQRVEASTSTTELLRIEVEVDYRSSGGGKGFGSVFNYAPWVAWLNRWSGSPWKQPLEDLADVLLGEVLECAGQQGIALEHALVRIGRPELAGLCVAVESKWSSR